jgi:hypothetical protein
MNAEYFFHRFIRCYPTEVGRREKISCRSLSKESAVCPTWRVGKKIAGGNTPGKRAPFKSHPGRGAGKGENQGEAIKGIYWNVFRSISSILLTVHAKRGFGILQS